MKTTLLIALGLTTTAFGQTAGSTEQNLKAAIADEYKSRAYYTAVSLQHGGALPYDHLKQAEANHAGALARLIQVKGFAVPKDGYARKPKETLAAWTARLGVPADLEKARLKAIEQERENVAMYDGFLAQNPPNDVKNVFTRLRAVSNDRHLVALEGNCQGEGMNAGKACGSCAGMGPGQGKGMGMGRGPGGGMGPGMGQGMGQGRGMARGFRGGRG